MYHKVIVMEIKETYEKYFSNASFTARYGEIVGFAVVIDVVRKTKTKE